MVDTLLAVMQFRLPQTLKERFRVMADHDGKSLSEASRDLIKLYVNGKVRFYE